MVGVGGTYSLAQDAFDQEGDTLTYVLVGGAWPTGVSMDTAGLITATTSFVTGTTGITVSVDDGTNSPVTSPSFDITSAELSAITPQTLRDAGYLLIDDFAGVDPTGVSDSYEGINAAILSTYKSNDVLWFTEGATYRVSDTIKCGAWDVSYSMPKLQGGGSGATRPKIVLDNGATGFGNSSDPQPVVCFRFFEGNGNPTNAGNILEFWPPDPMLQTNTYDPRTPAEGGNGPTAYYPGNVDLRGRSAQAFAGRFNNIDIDCGTNAGAFGLYMPLAQNSMCMDVTITATNALGGMWGFPGRNSVTMNLKIIGGVWQVREDPRDRESSAGPMIAGLTLVGDARTTTPLQTDTFIPTLIVGFDITQGVSGPVLTTGSNSNTANNAAVLIDGIIRSLGGTCFDNANERNLYIRNVFITGTSNLISSGGFSTVTAAGTWKLINEYAYTTPTATEYPQRSMVNGTVSGTGEAQPANDVTASVATPTVDYVARHTITVPMIDQGTYVNVLDHGATRSTQSNTTTAYGSNYDASTADSRQAFVDAMAAAQTAGHNRVFVPKGLYFIGSPGIAMLKDTIMMGVGAGVSRIGTKSNWTPTAKTYMVITADDATGTCHWSHIGLSMRTVPIGGSGGTLNQSTPYPNDWFSFIHWRTGRNSTSIPIDINQRQWQKGENITNPKSYHAFSGNGGGKHYGLDVSGRNMGHVDCRGLDISGTSEPLHIYGCNTEMSKKQPSIGNCLVNIEIASSSNIRLYGNKREGNSATSLINDSTNVCLYGFGRQVRGEKSPALYTHRITGTSNHIIIAPSTYDYTDTTSGTYMITEDLDGGSTHTISWPEGCSYYRRGIPTDVDVTIDPDPAPLKITDVSFTLGSLLNTAPGNAVFAEESDNWPITWASDGHQYASFGDGKGFHNLAGYTETRGSFGFSRIEGTETGYSAFDIYKSGEDMPTSEQGKCYGMLGANAKLYAAVDYFLVGGNGSGNDRYHGLSVIKSEDFGASWSEVIRWDSGDWGGTQTNGFYSMSFCQFGQDHAKPGTASSTAATDGYVYAIICEHDNDLYQVQTPGGISLMRCLESNLDSGTKSHWEYLSSIDGSNVPSWSTTITARTTIFQDATFGNDSSSIFYNEPLGRYVLTTMQGDRATANGCLFGMYEAPEPWGPWTLVIREDVLTLGIADGAACIYWNFSNKWLSVDGLDFVMVGTLFGQDEWGTVEGTFTYG